jgi:hypothetical protein
MAPTHTVAFDKTPRSSFMIIFNLWAIPVVALIFVALLGIEHFRPDAVASPHFAFTLGIVTSVIGGVCEWIGIKGRLFFLPIWLIGLGIFCFTLGWTGSIGFIAMLIAIGIWFFNVGRKKEIAQWDKAQQTLLTAAPDPYADEAAFWEWISTALFLPMWMNFTPELCRHDLAVLQPIRKSGIPLMPKENQRLGVLEQFLVTAQSAARPPSGNAKLFDPVSDLIEKRLRQAKRVGQGDKPVVPPLIRSQG